MIWGTTALWVLCRRGGTDHRQKRERERETERERERQRESMQCAGNCTRRALP